MLIIVDFAANAALGGDRPAHKAALGSHSREQYVTRKRQPVAGKGILST